ncbi:MAG: adenylate/guanylate cyclase domain-containing protein [Chitinophagaceae bacterium]
MQLPKSGHIEAFAMLVDINGFGRLVQKDFQGIAQFTSDVLIGGIAQVERFGGQVVGFAGDQFYAILDTPDNVFNACTGIAKDMRKQYEYFEDFPDVFSLTPENFGLKVGIEYGYLDVGKISSSFLGTQYIYTGRPVTYAARIMAAKEIKGNRVLFGLKAKEKGMDQWINDGPFYIGGKEGEIAYEYYALGIEDIWMPG